MALWLLKLSLALAMGLTAASAPQMAKSEVTTSPQEHHHSGHAQHQMVSNHAGHAAHSAHADNMVDHTAGKTAVGELDSAHCTSHNDCHHCCPLAWGSWAGIGLQAAPGMRPVRQVPGWQSASWLPGLRPPKS
jgi:hypothetical protein